MNKIPEGEGRKYDESKREEIRRILMGETPEDERYQLDEATREKLHKRLMGEFPEDEGLGRRIYEAVQRIDWTQIKKTTEGEGKQLDEKTREKIKRMVKNTQRDYVISSNVTSVVCGSLLLGLLVLLTPKPKKEFFSREVAYEKCWQEKGAREKRFDDLGIDLIKKNERVVESICEYIKGDFWTESRVVGYNQVLIFPSVYKKAKLEDRYFATILVKD